MVARSASNSESVFPKTRIAGTLKKISDLLASLSVPKWGIADITSLHPLADTYPKAFSILVDGILPCSDPVTVSECGDCEICINACPYGCINGVNWFPGISWKALFDANICSAKREAFRKSIGHKHECGLCLLACPLGNGSGKVEMKRTYL